jgi:hypothetical protein
VQMHAQSMYAAAAFAFTHVSSVIRKDRARGTAAAAAPTPPASCSSSSSFPLPLDPTEPKPEAAPELGAESGARMAVLEKRTVKARFPGREKRMKTRPRVRDSKRRETRICVWVSGFWDR